MTKDQAQKLKTLLDQGYTIFIHTMILDGPVTAIYKETQDIPNLGEWVYDSLEYEGEPLKDHLFDRVSIYRQIDPITLKPKPLRQ